MRRGVEEGVEWVMDISWTWDVIDGDGCNRFRALSIASPGDSPTSLSSSATHQLLLTPEPGQTYLASLPGGQL